MGVFSGAREKRYNGFTASFSNPPILPNSASASAAYTSLNFNRAENALQQVACWSSIALIAGLTSELPIDVFSKPDALTIPRPIKTPGYLLDVGGDGFGTPDWVYQFLVSMLLRGNAFGKVIERDPRADAGFPRHVTLYHPDNVRGYRDPDSGAAKWRVNGIEVPADDMWHRRAYALPGSLLGLSPVSYHAQTIGLGLSAQRFGTEFFSDGANPTGILVNSEEELNAEIAKTAKERFVAALNNTREPVVLGKGWSWQQISIAPEESQFLLTQKYSAAECARIYGPGVAEILGYESGSNLTYANVEQRNIHLMIYTLDLWFGRVERALSSMLPQPQYVRLNRNALLRTDLLTRYKAHATAIAAKILAPSEARTIEDMPPLTAEQQAELVTIPPPEMNPLKVTPPTK